VERLQAEPFREDVDPGFDRFLVKLTLLTHVVFVRHDLACTRALDFDLYLALWNT
jgi:hypothetical protein